MNKLNLLNIDSYIKQNNILEVKNPKLPSQNKFEPGSLFDPAIFGHPGSNARKKTFGYINLQNNFIHPEAYEIIKTIDPTFSRLLSNKVKYIFDSEKKIFLEQEDNNDNSSGISFLISHFKEINWEYYKKKDNKQKIEFVSNNLNQILISKYLVIPPGGIRDIDLTKKDAIRTSSEINDLYRILLLQKNDLSGIPEIDDAIMENMQKQLIKINQWIKNNLKGKKGLFRGSMLKKSMDYTSRLVLTSSSTDVQLGYVGVPWSTLLTLYEPLFSNHIFQKDNTILPNIKKYLQKDDNEELTYNNINKFVLDVNRNSESIDPEFKDHIIKILNDIFKNNSQTIMCKRDPTQTRNSWFSAHPIPIDGQAVVINSLDLGPIGGDTIPFDTKIYVNNELLNANEMFNKFNMQQVETISLNNESYRLLEDAYVKCLDVENHKIVQEKILYFHEHSNRRFYDWYYKNKFIFTASERKSYMVYDKPNNDYIKLDLKDIGTLENNSDYYFIKQSKVTNRIRYYSLKHCSYHFNKNISVGYDITVNNNRRNFMDERNWIRSNCDGDTLQIVPLFTEQAKKQANENMNPIYNKSKMMDTSSYNKKIYAPNHDAISIIFNATKTV